MPVRARDFRAVRNEPFGIALDDCGEFVVHGSMILSRRCRVEVVDLGAADEISANVTPTPNQLVHDDGDIANSRRVGG